ncbi:MAG: putative rane protein [Firmicutes bacterium]|nr:putative rane protein [Bacillota bacterium]
MKVAFWSNANELCTVSANLAAISVACAIRGPYSIISMENRLRSHNLGNAYNGGARANLLDEVGTNYYDGSGIEGLLRKIYRGDIRSNILKSYLKEIIHKHLYYIPQSRMLHNEIFDYELDHSIEPLFHMIDESADLCFIDTASNNNLSTKIILQEADLIVVNLCQKSSVLDDFFLQYSSLIPKSVFIISNYDTHSIYTIRQIAKLYQISIDKMIPIPCNERYSNAYISGSVYEFISRNLNCLKDNSNFSFIQSVKKASLMIIKRVEAIAQQKEIQQCH